MMSKVWHRTLPAVLAVVLAGAAAGGEKRLVFPRAVGFGVHTPAGRGGRIIRVTNLKSQGRGSLREALAAKGPRIVVFEVGGVIDLTRRMLNITEPFVTVAGQTAPSPGITIVRAGVSITTHDVLIRHIRVRPGDAEQKKRSGWEPDGISTAGGEAHDIVIDHCSISWAVDENLSASGPRTRGPKATSHRVTFSNCIIAEGLYDSSHAKGPHSRGSLIHDNCKDIAVIANLYAHNNRRNPYFKAHCTGVVINNLIYNPGRAAVQVNYVNREWRSVAAEPVNCRISVVGNVMIHGANTHQGLPLVAPRGDVYLEDNVAIDRSGKPVAMTGGKVRILKTRPSWPAGLKALPAGKVLDHVVRHAGARPRDRDEADKRIVRDLLARRGRFINSQRDVGGYPNPKPTARKLRPPAGDIDAWLARCAAEVE